MEVNIMGLQIDGTTSLEHNNFKMFLYTVQTLAGSQGFYSRLQAQINEWTPEEFENARNYFNNLPQKFNDHVDVVLFLEQ